MSRHFSSAVRAAARIIWTFNGTTRNLERDLAAVEQAVRANPELAKKVKKGLIKYVLVVIGHSIVVLGF